MKSRSAAAPDASPVRRSPPRREPPLRKSGADEPAERRKRATHRRAAEIIEAAAKVFAERGYHGATTQDIADVLKIRQASLYYYFPSKEVALELVCMRGVEGFFETEKAIADGPGTATERLSGLIRAHISPLLDRGNFMKVFLTQRQFLPAHSRRKVRKVSREIEANFETVLKQGQRSGEFRDDLDTRLVTLSILSVVNGCAAWYPRERVSLERIGGEFISLILRGIDAPRTGAEKWARRSFSRRRNQTI
ncbi:TetR/AcrR family transcriptional regulator [Pseudorhodoplanes sp.]|uniref:TetR/AcrR family transcriptional regulator n=1 Tax=Pseudorhodoplanes sp. TaxID=1934341 RepID=UPI003D0A3279